MLITSYRGWRSSVSALLRLYIYIVTIVHEVALTREHLTWSLYKGVLCTEGYSVLDYYDQTYTIKRINTYQRNYYIQVSYGIVQLDEETGSPPLGVQVTHDGGAIGIQLGIDTMVMCTTKHFYTLPLVEVMAGVHGLRPYSRFGVPYWLGYSFKCREER